jgi:predicted kinase
MRTIVILKGIPASGKSSFAKELLKKYPGKYKRINKDILRLMLDNDIHTTANENFITNIRDAIIEQSLAKGYDVIVDDTNLSDKHYLAICDIAKRIGDTRVFEKFFDISLKDAILYNTTREKPVPEHIVTNMFEKYIKNRKVEVRDVYFPPIRKTFVSLPNKKDAVIIDIDGTLALNYSGRDYYDYSLVGEDTLDEYVAYLTTLFYEAGLEIILLSGRDDCCKDATIKWLNDNNVPFEKLIMRITGDTRKDSIVKEELYHALIEPEYQVLFAVDDRPSICKLYRRLGITVLQVNDINF